MRLTDLVNRISPTQDDARVRAAAQDRVAQLRAWMAAERLDSVLISRRDNFAWLTCGGDSHVLMQTELGSGHLLITHDRQYLLAYPMDVDRLLDEQIPGQGYEPIITKWYEGDPRSPALRLGGTQIAADSPLEGTRFVELHRTHGPLNALELDRSRWLGHQTALVLEAVAGWMRPGMAETEIARHLHACLIEVGIDPEVIITGSDERIGKYWHAVPSGKRLEQFALIHGASSRWGLHANVNRLVSFGAPPPAIGLAHLAALTVEARILGLLREGVAYADILTHQKQWYAELGYPDAWERHFQGGPTGYVIGDATRCFTDLRVEENQAFDWFLTVDGVQVEELVLLTASGVEVASIGEVWPRMAVNVASGTITLPGIYIR